MPLKSFLIGPVEEGKQDSVEPFYLPEDAYFELEDVYVWRGRVRKRFGYSLIGSNDLNSRLRINLGDTDGSGNISISVPGSIFKIGQMFSVGEEVFTVNNLGLSVAVTAITKANPGEVTTGSDHGFATNDIVYIDKVVGMTEVNQLFFTITVTSTTTFTLGVDTTAFGTYISGGKVNQGVSTLSTGSGNGIIAANNGGIAGIQINGSTADTPCFFYPAEPVMGLRLRESKDVNNEGVIAFDTQFSYIRFQGGWGRLGSDVWTGTDSQFFWSTNYRGAKPYETFFYVVNFNTADNIKFLPEGSSTWTNFRPKLTDFGEDRFLETCRILLPFKNRLVAFNTVEDEGGVDRTYFNRCRFSRFGDPTNALTSWVDNRKGGGGFIDAPTKEQIITAERIKDRLIVYFERSTWELVYAGFNAAPFKWQRINNELGCESSFSVVGFDQSVLGVGNVGIHTCNGINVTRIDEKIIEEVFKIHNGNDGPARVYGIRDFHNEVVYWTFPDHSNDPKFPNRIFLYNYRNDTWAFFNDSFTCFGRFQKPSDLTWATVQDTYSTWAEWNDPWGSPLYQSSFPNIIAGNQEGFVFVLENGLAKNSQSLYVTTMNPGASSLTVIDHNLKNGDYMLLEGLQGKDLPVKDPLTALNGTVVQVTKIDSNTISIKPDKFDGTYTGGGKLSRISNLKILTKSFNPGTSVGQQFRIPYVDFLMNRTVDGEISLDYLLDTASGNSIQDNTKQDDPKDNVLLGSNILYTKPEDTELFRVDQNQIWHRYYVQSQSQFLQFLFFMSDAQMKNLEISRSDFELHAINFYVEPQGRIIG